jgi:hypothetical protein
MKRNSSRKVAYFSTVLAAYVVQMDETRNAYRNFVGKSPTYRTKKEMT